MAGIHLPPAMAALRTDLQDIVADLEKCSSYGAVWLSARHGLSIVVDDRQEQVTDAPRTAGAVLTAYDGAALRELAISGLDRSAVAAAAKNLVHDFPAKNGAARAHPIDPGAPRHGDFSTPVASMTTRAKLERVRDLHRRLRALEPRLINVSIRYGDIYEDSVFVNRAADLAQHLELGRIYVIAFAAGPGGVRYDLAIKSGRIDGGDLDFTDDELHAMAARTLALVDAERIEPGDYTVIASPGVAGVIAHESFGHGVETDMFLKERAKAAYHIDHEVGSPLVNMLDDPSVPGAFGSYFFDDEGALAAPTPIVEQGLFKRGITDLYSAMALGLPRSANGRRQDFSRKAYARMSNTFFASGATPVPELFAQVDNGIYLEQWESGMEDPQGWGIQVTCRYGHEIKGGRVTDRLFAPIVVTGYVPDVLKTVTAVGNDFELGPGGCGKGHKELVRVSSGGPHLLLKARLS